MLIAGLADSQIDENSRLLEHDRVMQFIVEDARRRGVSLVIHAGDVYENPRGSTARERASVAWFVREVTEFATLVVVGGNHEAPGEVEELAKLRTGRWPVHAYERAQTDLIKTPEGLVSIAALPWPRKANLLAMLPPVSPTEVDRAAVEALRAIFVAFRAELDVARAKWPTLLVAHAQVRGASSDSDQPMVGRELEVGLEDLGLCEAAFTLLGHIHKPQDWTHGGRPIVYPGSPRRTSYASGELLPKGYVLAEFDGPRLDRWERVETPATPLALVEAKWTAGQEALGEGVLRWAGAGGSLTYVAREVLEDVRGAEIRFRYSVAADQRGPARRAAEEWAASALGCGAAEVKLEERVMAVSTARAPEIARLDSLEEKLGKFLEVRGVEVEPVRWARICERLRGIEQKVGGR